MCYCVCVKSYWTLFYSIALLPSLFFVPIYINGHHTSPRAPRPSLTLVLRDIDSIVAMHAGKASLIALSHPLTINGGPGSRRRASGRVEGEFCKGEEHGWRAKQQPRFLGCCCFLQEVVKGRGGVILKAITSSWLDVGSPVGLTVRSAQRRCMFCGETDRTRWGGLGYALCAH